MSINYLKSISKRAGFSIIESIFSLLVISMAFGLIMLTTQLIRSEKWEDRDGIFYRYLDVIESPDYQFKVMNVERNSVKLKSKKENKEYIMEKYENMVRLRGVKGGHIPIILRVNHASWSTHHHVLTSRIKIDGVNYEAKSYL
ncbi:competence type IV pilus minor pilin ComGF [Fructilactobacillus fructivorans]|nr:competence type IV pilus minor pilin ComGF [Fructilactobacillus fructivorans]MCT0151184.1 hypothetical protein [Fructilactobacillus fructivorans]MCT2867740.1 hypothetical protein [Fructilactobacillus fructivorans]MCT2868743.1 hypothetical protein [Fructilactobacillus fructivorans]MCT2874087.1 hypothetical protein [Fructilactobacillus fructivorans]